MNLLISLASIAFLAGIPLTHDQSDERHYARTGGDILERGAYKGKIAIINTAGADFSADVDAISKRLKGELEVNVSASSDKPSDPPIVIKRAAATAAIVVVNDPTTASMLIAPDERWAVVNVARIVDDLPSPTAKASFRSSRIRKQIIKAFCVLLGSSASQYAGNIMNTTCSRELDRCKEQLPVDVIDKIQKYMTAIGITRASYTTYRKACREGWAPQPTNDVQRAIWDKVHAPPSKPMKITYDKAAQKPVVK